MIYNREVQPVTPPFNPQGKEQPSTYFVQDRSNAEELERLQLQDHLLTTAMGGVLSEQPEPHRFTRILDVACGPGGWLIELARVYPNCDVLVGVDISQRMVEYARKQAYDARHDYITFHVMDSLRMLEFPNQFFHLVNLRCGSSFVRTWDWPKLLEEMRRVCRPDGVIRLTEPAILTQSSSPALLRLNALLQHAFVRAGYYFEHTPTGITAHLSRLLKQYGGRRIQVQERPYSLLFQAGTPAGQAFIDDLVHAFRVLRPFLAKWGALPADYDTLYQQALAEMQQPDFAATGELLTAWAAPQPHGYTTEHTTTPQGAERGEEMKDQ
jgi:ubiquinone/menaquinone biosynthesis C-methylase UbiE